MLPKDRLVNTPTHTMKTIPASQITKKTNPIKRKYLNYG